MSLEEEREEGENFNLELSSGTRETGIGSLECGFDTSYE